MCPVLADNTLLMPAFALPSPPAPLTGRPSLQTERSPTASDPCQRVAPWPAGYPPGQRVAPLVCRGHQARSVGGALSPVTLSAPDHSTSELLRTLSRMAASKPTSWLSGPSDRLSHYSLYLGALAGGLGCFPLDDEASPPPSHFCWRLVAFAVWLESVSAWPPRPSSGPTSTRRPQQS